MTILLVSSMQTCKINSKIPSKNKVADEKTPGQRRKCKNKIEMEFELYKLELGLKEQR